MPKELTATGNLEAKLSQSQIQIRRIPSHAPWGWMAAGWRDLSTIPGISFVYGIAFALLAVLLTAGLLQFGLQSLILAVAGGFLLIGPLVAVGLYEASRLLESCEPVSLSKVVLAGRRAPGRLGVFGAVLVFAYAVWLQIAMLLFRLFMGSDELPPASEFVPALLFTPQGHGLLATGTLVGGILATIVFSISAISVPLLLTRRVDTITAMAASVEAVVKNPIPMALWAALIASFMMLGTMTMFAGLIIAFPLIGHATWHAFRALVVQNDD